ncbi:RES family NAD+ phosphorylase [Streptomyces nogalater]
MLGTALPEQARQPNRMSPAGIPLFYGADSREAAVQEVTRHASDHISYVTSAAFETTGPFRVVDFTLLDPVPSLFDTDRAHLRRALMFLHEFVKQISAGADGREHLDYVPTQIVTEYLLRVFDRQHPVDGLLFASSAAGPGSVCTVLDTLRNTASTRTTPTPACTARCAWSAEHCTPTNLCHPAPRELTRQPVGLISAAGRTEAEIACHRRAVRLLNRPTGCAPAARETVHCSLCDKAAAAARCDAVTCTAATCAGHPHASSPPSRTAAEPAGRSCSRFLHHLSGPGKRTVYRENLP